MSEKPPWGVNYLEERDKEKSRQITLPAPPKCQLQANPYSFGIKFALGFWSATILFWAIVLGFYGALGWWRG